MFANLATRIDPLIRAIYSDSTQYYASTYSKHGGRMHRNSFFHSKVYTIIRFKSQKHYRNWFYLFTKCVLTLHFNMTQ